MKVVLFINGSLGLRILNFVAHIPEYTISAIVLNSEKKRSVNYIEEVQRVIDIRNIHTRIVIWEGKVVQLEKFYSNFESATHGVSALFGHVLPEELISKFTGGILNLHPSLLPVGRGANPITWSIVNQQAQGVTLHLIDQNLDTGDIIFQKELSTNIGMSAGEVYGLAMDELFDAFTMYFPSWIRGELVAFPQRELEYSQRSSNELVQLQVIREDEVFSFGEFVRRMQATTFSDGRLPLFHDNFGNVWEVSFDISLVQNKKESGE
jgi:methionyl-tRNA formyltransferase